MKTIITAAFFFLAASQIFSQRIPLFLKPGNDFYGEEKHHFCSHFEKQKELSTMMTAIERRSYDVLSYDLYMDWYNLMNNEGNTPEDKHFDGIQKMMIALNKDTNMIEIDGPGLDINRIFIDGEETFDFTQPDIDGYIYITFAVKKSKEDTINLDIHYTYISKFKDIGLFVYPKGYFGDFSPPYKKWDEILQDSVTVRDSILIPERIAYTMSEPVMARIWMPCSDRPYDKADVSITVKVPKGYSVASNGLLEEKVIKDDSITYYWKSYSPMTTYLMSVSASKFKEFSHWYKRVTNPDDSVEVKYYCWEEDYYNNDTTGFHYNAPRTYYDVVNMMEFLSETFVEYPFEKYGMVSLQPYIYGGMEHQTITALKRLFTRGCDRWGRDIRHGSQNIIMHELVHQWLGDLITCATWNDIWINEGGAVWGEYLWLDYKYGELWYKWTLLGKRDYYLYYDDGIELPPVYGLPIGQVFHQSLTYIKASWIYHMLYAALGNEKMLSVMRGMFRDYGNTSIETDDFKNYFKQSLPDSKIDFDTFFDQWIYNPGHPVFDMKVNASRIEGENRVKVRLTQIQDFGEVPKVFKHPVAVEFYGPGKVRHLDTLYVKKREQTFDIITPFMPDSAFIDTTFILCEVNSRIISGVKTENKAFEDEVRVYPNPVYRGSISKIYLKNKTPDYTIIEIFDIFGRNAQNIYKGYLEKGAYTFEFAANQMPPGAYFVRIKNSTGILTKNISIVK